MPVLWIALALSGCRDREPSEEDTLPGGDSALGTTGQAPWDPIWATWEGEAVVPLVDGAALDEPLTDLRSEVYAMRSSAGLSPGKHTVTNPRSSGGSLSLTVLPYGIEDSFEAKEIIGIPFSLDTETPWVVRPEGVGDFLLDQLGGVWLTVVAVDGEEAVFEVHTRSALDGEPICRVLRAKGTLTATGTLTWGSEEIALDGEALLTGLAIRGGWTADGAVVGGVEASGALHVDTIAPFFEGQVDDTDPGYLCDLFAGFGLSCVDCPTTDHQCLEIIFHAGLMTPHTGEWPTEPPECGIDAEDLNGPYLVLPEDCGSSSPTCAGGMLGILGLSGLLRRRDRSRNVPGEHCVWQ